MATQAERGAAMRNRHRKLARGVTVEITRKGKTPITITAAVGRSNIDTNQIGDGTARLDRGEREYLIEVADLVDGDGPFVPTIGDLYAETISGVAYVFECMRSNDLPAWDWHDSGRTTVRVRTKQKNS